MIRKKPPLFPGEGHVRFAGHAGPASYVIEGDPRALRPGTARLRGAVTLDAELAREAFRAGEGLLRLDDGAELRIVMIGHTPGAAEVFVELRA